LADVDGGHEQVSASERAAATNGLRGRGTLLTITDLCAGYGRSQVLENVSFSMGAESVAIIGRNGMGKSTLCNTIIGLLPTTSGTTVLDGTTLTGRHPEKIAQAGIAYVPQGRRLFSTLTVDEHIAMLAKSARGRRWTPDNVLELFPRLALRRRSRAVELSGGEQQMLAVARALLLNGTLVMMDEPSEGLAPAIVDSLIETVRHLVTEGVAVLVVEQNLYAATNMAERILVMVAGRIAAETTATALLDDPNLQRRYLGVDTIEDT
jgi:branched-chain amino acid transport system ATP-binding protein